MLIARPIPLPKSPRTMIKQCADPEPFKNRRWKIFAWRISGDKD
jgi:hypothetical protein